MTENPKLIRARKEGKAPLEYLVLSVLEGDAYVHKGGADKYGIRNWLKDRIKASTYIASILRHLKAWAEGEDIDPESGHSHLYHIRSACAIVLDSAKHGTLIDDRNCCESINDKQEAPDANCVSLPDGSCVSDKDCMHGPAKLLSPVAEAAMQYQRGQQIAMGAAAERETLPDPNDWFVRHTPADFGFEVLEVLSPAEERELDFLERQSEALSNFRCHCRTGESCSLCVAKPDLSSRPIPGCTCHYCEEARNAT